MLYARCAFLVVLQTSDILIADSSEGNYIEMSKGAPISNREVEELLFFKNLLPSTSGEEATVAHLRKQ